MIILKKFLIKIYPFVKETAEAYALIRKDPILFGMFIMAFILSVIMLIKFSGFSSPFTDFIVNAVFDSSDADAWSN